MMSVIFLGPIIQAAMQAATAAPSMGGVVAPATFSSAIDRLRAEGMAVVGRRAAIATELEAVQERLACIDYDKADMFLDEKKLLSAQGFPFSEAELVTMTKRFLFREAGLKNPSILAPDMVFMGPFVGGKDGLPREAYLSAVGGFDIKSAFPDINPGFHSFRADPLDAGRVWFVSQASGTDTGGFLGNAPTGKRFETPPQACSVKWDENGKVIKYTIGHVMERSIGNTGGLGGIFGPAYAIGKPLPFPEARPWKPSKRYKALMLVSRFAAWLKTLKK